MNQRKTGQIGVQMMMLKQEVTTHGLDVVLRRVAEMGFRAVEMSQISMTPENVRILNEAQETLGIRVAAMTCCVTDFTPEYAAIIDTLERSFDKIVADCRAVHCTTLRIGIVPLAYASSAEKMIEHLELCEQYALRLKELGIDLYYHAHNMEFYPIDGKPLLTLMKERTTALGFELDSHWMWCGGMDPVAYLKSFAGRVRLIHLKDYRIGLLPEKPVSLHTITQFAEVGEGTLDMPAILEAGLASGGEYFFIEQDDTYGKDVWDCLQLSHDNLVAMGYGDWF